MSARTPPNPSEQLMKVNEEPLLPKSGRGRLKGQNINPGRSQVLIIFWVLKQSVERNCLTFSSRKCFGE